METRLIYYHNGSLSPRHSLYNFQQHLFTYNRLIQILGIDFYTETWYPRIYFSTYLAAMEIFPQSFISRYRFFSPSMSLRRICSSLTRSLPYDLMLKDEIYPVNIFHQDKFFYGDNIFVLSPEPVVFKGKHGVIPIAILDFFKEIHAYIYKVFFWTTMFGKSMKLSQVL